MIKTFEEDGGAFANRSMDRAYMNWSSVMYSGVVLFAIAYFFVYGRHVYEGPVVLVKPDY